MCLLCEWFKVDLGCLLHKTHTYQNHQTIILFQDTVLLPWYIFAIMVRPIQDTAWVYNLSWISSTHPGTPSLAQTSANLLGLNPFITEKQVIVIMNINCCSRSQKTNMNHPLHTFDAMSCTSICLFSKISPSAAVKCMWACGWLATTNSFHQHSNGHFT